MQAADCVYLEDGVVLEGYIKASPLLHGSLWFRYNPTTAVDKAKLNRQMSQAGSDEERKERYAARFVASKLVEWDLETSGGTPVEISEETIAYRLQSAVNLKLYQIVMGNWATDPIPSPAVPGTEDGVDLDRAAKN